MCPRKRRVKQGHLTHDLPGTEKRKRDDDSTDHRLKAAPGSVLKLFRVNVTAEDQPERNRCLYCHIKEGCLQLSTVCVFVSQNKSVVFLLTKLIQHFILHFFLNCLKNVKKKKLKNSFRKAAATVPKSLFDFACVPRPPFQTLGGRSRRALPPHRFMIAGQCFTLRKLDTSSPTKRAGLAPLESGL